MSFLFRKFPGRHAVLILVTIGLLVAIGYIDRQLMADYPYVDFLWLIPIIFSAVLLSPLETVAVALTAAILSLISLVGLEHMFDYTLSAFIGIVGISLSITASLIKKRISRISAVHDVVDRSPLAFAEFKYPGYRIAGHNKAFLRLWINAGAGNGHANIHEIFPQQAADRLSVFMDDAVNSRDVVECPEFRTTDAEGKDMYLRIHFVPVTPLGASSPKSVALFADEITDAVSRSRTREAALKISAQAMSSLKMEETISVVMEGLGYISETDSGALLMLEDDQWVGKTGFGLYDDERVKSLRYPYDELESAVFAVETKQVLASDDVAADSRFEALHGRQFEVASTMVVPLVTGNRVVGVAYLSERDEKRSFSEEQLKFAMIIGSHAALALENAFIYENEHTMRKSLEAIELVSEAGLVSLDLDEVLMELVGRTQDVMQMDAAMILLYDEADEMLVGCAATGRFSGRLSETRLKPGEALAGRAFAEGAPLKIDNLKGHKQEVCPQQCMDENCCPFSESSGILSVLAVPLRIAGKKIGVLQVGSRREAAFEAKEWGLIQVLADRASLAVHNSMLHDTTIRELKRVALLRDIAATCAETHDIRLIAEKALRCVYDRLGCQIASVYMVDREKNILVNLAFVGHNSELMREYQVRPLDGGSLLVRSVRERRIITHEDISTADASEAEADILHKLGIEQNRRVTLPIIHENEVVGGMALVFPDSKRFTPAGLDAIRSIANQLAVPMKNFHIQDSLLEKVED